MNRKSLERNIKIYPFYRAFSYDFLFLWTISILYLTWKGLSYSQTIYLDAVFMVAAFFLQIPLTKLMNKIGLATSLRIAGVLKVAFAVIYLFTSNFWLFAFANVLFGISAAFQNVGDSEILTYTLKNIDNEKDYQKIEGRGVYLHYIIEALAAVVSGYMFQYIHPTAPIWACFACCVILTLLSFLMKNPSKNEVVASEENQDILVEVVEEPKKVQRKRKGKSYRQIVKDKFIIAMMIFSFCFWGIMSVYSTLSKVYFQEIGTPVWLFGYIYFAFKIISALASKLQFKLELKRGVKSLVLFAFLAIFTYAFNGVLTLFNFSSIITIVLVTLMFSLQNAIRAPYRIFVKNYITMSSKKENLSKSLTLYSMAEYLGYTFITLIVAVVMDITNNSYSLTNIIISSIIAIPMAISIVIFIREIVKRYAKKHTIVRKDMEDDL